MRIGSAEELPFADGDFDAALAQLVINLVDDPPAAVAEMARVVKSGGIVAACFWDDEQMPLVELGTFGVSAAYESLDDLFYSFEVGVGHSGALFRRLGSPEGEFQLTATVRSVRGLR